jgi:sigma-B regulation protein RsbU (phosphoserine phosphatase)
MRRQHGRSAKDVNNALVRELNDFRQNNEFPDDLTVLTCRIFGKLEEEM